MDQISKPFDSYIISYVTGYPHDCVITCFNGETYAGRLIFYKLNADLPPNVMFNDAPSLHYHTTHYQQIIDIFRYEKPLMLFFVPTSKTGGVITSEREPVGEQEGAGVPQTPPTPPATRQA